MESKHWDWIGDLAGLRARLSPEHEAIFDLDYNRSYTYAEVNERANRLANYLTADVGVTFGDRVGFIARNQIEMFDGLFACGKIGAIFVPYNLRLSADELKKLIDLEQLKVLFYDKDFAQTVESLKALGCHCNNFVLISDVEKASSAPLYADILASAKTTPMRCKTLELDDIAMLIHTGGTTGLPKAAKISYRAVLFNALNNILDWGFTNQDCAHLILPLFHTGGWNIITLAMLQAGGRLLINRSFDPKLTLKVVNEYRPSCIFGAATIFRMIHELPEFDTTDWSSVRWVMSGAAPTPSQVMEKFWEKGVKFCAGYGLTEGGPMNLATPVAHITLERIKEKSTSVGVPFHFTCAQIVDENGDAVADGQTGELIFSGPQIFSGYWENDAETAKTLKDGWVYTGDIAMRDSDGFYYIVGRKKNMYISGGENVFPPEIESALYEMPEVFECSVIGVPDAKWGEVGKAIIALKPGMSLAKQQVIDTLSKRLAHYKVPSYVVFVAEVPKNTVGKIVAQDVIKLYGTPSDS